MKTARTVALPLLLTLVLSTLFSPPAFAATFTVNSANDVNDGSCDGTHCSLREAILAANANAGPDTIHFDIPGCGGVCTISPASNLPFLLDGETTIDGYSQSGAAMATETTPATLLVELDGTSVTNNNGLNITSAGNEVSGLIINNFGLYGIVIYGSAASDNHIWGNVIGTDESNSVAIGNGGGVGLGDGAHDNTLGGDTFSERNVISGNDLNGVDVMPIPGVVTYGNTISGNFIGTTLDGSAALPNGVAGINVAYGTYGNTVGGTTAEERNIISGNTADGVVIWRPLTTDNLVIGNYIGTNREGNASLANGLNGVSIYGGAHGNTIGGDSASERNVISGNSSNGVRLYGVDTNENQLAGNYIGTNAAGTAALPNGTNGVIVTEGASENTIGGSLSGEGNTISGNDEIGVLITDGTDVPEYPSGNLVIGNQIGTNAAATSEITNLYGGVLINGGAKDNRVGGSTTLERNLISGNPSGLVISGAGTTGNIAIGNYIGLAADGTSSIPNGNGVLIWGGAQSNQIGGDSPEERNIIAGNSGFGVHIDDADTDLNAISGNYIGLDASGSTALGNGYDGVRISGGAQSNTIGGDSAGEGNVIADSGWDGVLLRHSGTDDNEIVGNYIGTDPTGLIGRGNGRSGVAIMDGPEGTIIGGSVEASRNIICDNEDPGIHVYGGGTDGTIISGNHVGVGADGMTALPNGNGGIWIEAGSSNTTIGGSSAGAGNVVASHSVYQILMSGTGTENAEIAGNIIGLAADGLTDLASSGSGVSLGSGVNHVTIGGTSPGARNIISGSATGVYLHGAGNHSNKVLGNFIGPDISGEVAVGNSHYGIGIDDGASDNEIGGDAAGEGNVISGNGEHGILITGATSNGNVIQGNKIGTNASGMSALPNNYSGIFLRNETQSNTIGGGTAGSGNLISGNLTNGIHIQDANTNGTLIQGNWIGVNAAGWGDLGNGEYGILIGDGITNTTIGPANRIAYNGLGGLDIYGASTDGVVITENSIFANAYDGIILDLGANNNILAPTIASTSLSSLLIEGTACPGCTVEVFSNPENEAQGKIFHGSTTADGSGDWSLTLECIGNPYLTATATDSVDGTSRFSTVFTSTVECAFMPVIMK